MENAAVKETESKNQSSRLSKKDQKESSRS